MTVIYTNTGALYAQQAINTNQRALSRVMEQLSTGKRINNPEDDVAGLAISTRLTTQIRALNQAVRNANDGISLVQTAEGATEEVTNMLQRMRELAIQSINDTNGAFDHSGLDIEFQKLAAQIQSIASQTQWNGTNLLDKTGGASGVFKFQVGANAGETIAVTFANMTTKSTGILSTIATQTITSSAKSTSALSAIFSALDTMSLERAKMGAVISRLQFAGDNLANVSAKTQESRSRIEDTDYSIATTELAKRNIIQQAAQAMLAQANQMPNMVLQLLK